MHNALPLHVPPSVGVFLRRDGDWLRCAEAGCGDRAFWGIFRDGDFLRVKVAQHRAKMHAGRPQRAQAGRPQRRAAAGNAPAAGLLEAVSAFVAAHVGGARRLGRGVSREVFPFGPDYVLKVALDSHGGHNKAEFEAYRDAPEWARKLLAPVVAVDPAGKWLLMRKAERIQEASQRECDKLAEALQHKIGDLHAANVGWLDGRWVAIDYAGGWLAREVRW